MIEKAMEALTEKDHKALALCFSENCMLFDYCPSLNGMPNNFIYGNPCLEMHYKKQFFAQDMEIAEVQIEGKDRASYFGAYGGPYIFARFEIEEYDSDGLIKKAVVRPV